MIKKLVYNLGVYEKGFYQSCTLNESGVGYKQTKEYMHWCNLLYRCSPKAQIKQPSYIGCGVSENFKNFQYFAGWCNNQVGFSEKGWCLDKDLILRGE